MKKTIYSLAFCLPALSGLLAQQTEEYCTPAVVGLPRTKGLILKYEMITDYKITSDGKNGYSDADAEVTKNSRAEIKLRFPVINKPSLVIAGGSAISRKNFILMILLPVPTPSTRAWKIRTCVRRGYNCI